MTRIEVQAFLLRVRQACLDGTVMIDEYALDRADEDFEWDAEVIVSDVLPALAVDDYDDSQASRTWGLMHIFKASFEVGVVYVKIAERNNIIVVSLHRDDE